MRLRYQTPRDPTLTHQVVLCIQHGTASVVVSCNCRGVHHSNKEVTYVPMGKVKDLDESRRLYNDPANHNKPFTKEDEAKW